MKAQGKRAGLYVRISDDREDRQVGVREQEKDARALASRHSLEVAQVYRENDTSAFKRRMVTLPDGTKGLRVVRPEWRRALADLQDGSIDVLIGYDLDRVVRDPRDLEDLIDICEQHGRRALSVTGSLQLENNAGVTLARVAVAMANQSSRDTARRVARARQTAAVEGRWAGGGKRAYGLTSDRSAVITAEAEVIASIAADVLTGKSISAITTRLRAQGAPTATGAPWNGRSVRSVVTKPAVAGKLVHRGEVVGDAPWPAILPEDTWLRVCEELSARTPKLSNQLTHWLSGILVCGVCGMHLRANGDRYWCGSIASRGMRGCGKISIIAAPTEDAIRTLILARLRQTKVRAQPVTSIAPDDTQLAELASMWGAGEISLVEYRAARAKILERVAAHTAAPSLPAWVGPHVADEWDDKPPAAKRRVAAALLEGVVVHPSTGRHWSSARLDAQWRQT